MLGREIVRTLDFGVGIVILIMISLLTLIGWTIGSTDQSARKTETLIVQRQIGKVVDEFRAQKFNIDYSSIKWIEELPQMRAIIFQSNNTQSKYKVISRPGSRIDRLTRAAKVEYRIQHTIDMLGQLDPMGDRVEFMTLGEEGNETLAFVMRINIESINVSNYNKDLNDNINLNDGVFYAVNVLDFPQFAKDLEPISIDLSPIYYGAIADNMLDGHLQLQSADGMTVATLIWRGQRVFSFFREYLFYIIAIIVVLAFTIVLKLRNVWHLARKKLVEKIHSIEEITYKDNLTSMPNRLALFEYLKSTFPSEAENPPVTVMVLDLDNVGRVNDNFGHNAGDFLILNASIAFQEVFGVEEYLARISGDKFVAILSGTISDAMLLTLHTKISRILMTRDNIAILRNNISISIGAVRSIDHQGNGEQLLKFAEIAVNGAKSLGGGTVVTYDYCLKTSVSVNYNIENEINKALDDGQFILHYQPVVSSKEKLVTGYEGLIRWQHPDRGFIPPSEFIPIAEKSDLIQKISKFVIDRALFELKDHDNCTISVNITGRELASDWFYEFVMSSLDKHSVDPTRLCLELTETSFIADPEHVAISMEELQQKGVRFAIDDFGAGYSSLSYLLKFKFDVLKIDRDFVISIEDKPEATIIITSVVALAQNLGMRVVGEGVETQAQSSFLEIAGCDSLQGYLFSKPQSIHNIKKNVSEKDSPDNKSSSNTSRIQAA